MCSEPEETEPKMPLRGPDPSYRAFPVADVRGHSLFTPAG